MTPIDPLCRGCRKPRSSRPLGKYAQPSGLCNGCKASIASASRNQPSAKRTANRERIKRQSWNASPRSWEFATDTHGAKQERGKGWVETAERPNLRGLFKIGAKLAQGTVQAIGWNGQGRYYVLVDDYGVATQVAASVVEQGGA